jgi:hypothetical protein
VYGGSRTPLPQRKRQGLPQTGHSQPVSIVLQSEEHPSPLT